MTHRAALYTVRVRPRGGKEESDFRLLGDIDEEGTSLLVAIESILPGFVSYTQDQGKVAQYIEGTRSGQELRLLFHHGQSGVAGDIIDPKGKLRIHLRAEDTEFLPCAALFDLPLDQKIGWLAVHNNSGRGIKGLLAKGLHERLAQKYELLLEITPFVEGAALEEAVAQHKVEKVKLVKLETPTDRAAKSTDRWIPGNETGRLELEITARKGARIITNLLGRYLHGETGVFGEIVEFQGLKFEEASVEVTLAGGARKTFNIEKPEAGHAITEDLNNLKFDDQGLPTPNSVFAGLRAALKHVTQGG